jgi:hypothetical protein
MPEFSLDGLASGVRLLMVVVAAAGLMWLVSLWLGKPSERET